jgi:hypothetical protein
MVKVDLAQLANLPTEVALAFIALDYVLAVDFLYPVVTPETLQSITGSRPILPGILATDTILE